ncbi:DNA-directed RNA polymerase I subunit RPA1-like [Cucumis melo var. makuwa]|uniref:DNA-directed RNA polymerase I subunit RPA1-like n=1 Tax=Cucumis melo var. makuwa TaxID=1194695 RepID=A0A5A7TXV5_CUCMM|nr:DNA-directed RNA polymerase I subunit RPA1-like [Cucumis melo var. makuwa]
MNVSNAIGIEREDGDELNEAYWQDPMKYCNAPKLEDCFDEFPNVTTSDSSLNIGIRYGPTFLLEGSTELTLEFSGLAVDPLSVDSIEGHNRVSGKGFPTTGPRIQAENVEIHRGLHCALRICASFESTRLICASFGSTRLICASFGSTRLICASFGSTRLRCASFESTRLTCASFGSTRLICASFRSTRLICAFYGTTRLLCRVGAQRGADRREAGRMREGHMDASGFLIASATNPISMTVKIHSCEHILNERKKGKCFHKHEYSLNDGKMCFSSNVRANPKSVRGKFPGWGVVRKMWPDATGYPSVCH